MGILVAIAPMAVLGGWALLTYSEGRRQSEARLRRAMSVSRTSWELAFGLSLSAQGLVIASFMAHPSPRDVLSLAGLLGFAAIALPVAAELVVRSISRMRGEA